MRGARLRGGLVATFVSGGFVVVACGPTPPPISQTASTSLSADLARVEQAAALHDRSGAQAELTILRNQVLAYEAAGQISRSRAGQLLHTSAMIEGDLALIPTTTTTSAPPPAHDHHHPHGGGGGDH